MSHQREQLFSTVGIEIHQVLDELGPTNAHPAEHHLVCVDYKSSDVLVLHDNPVGGKKSYQKYNAFGDVVEVHEEVVAHSGIELPFREGFIGRNADKEYFDVPVKGFLLGCMGDEVEYAYVSCNYSDIVRTTALIPIEDIASIELRPASERDFLARYYYDFDFRKYYSIPILMENGEVVASREFDQNDVEGVRVQLAHLEGEIIYSKR